MPTIRKRATNWEAQVRKRGWPTVTRSFPTKADAVQWATERENEMRRGTFVDTSNLRETTLKDLLEKFRDEVTPTRRGKEPETYRLNAMCALPMAALTLDRVTTQVVIEWREQRRTKVSGDTVRREMNLLSRVFTHARTEWGFHVQHPVEKLERPSASAPRSRRPVRAELRKLFRQLAVRRHPDGTAMANRNPWVRPAAAFALRTAMRRGEIIALRWDDVNYKERYAFVRESKNGDARQVPLSRKAEAILRRIPQGKGADPVFPTTASALKQAFARARERSGVVNLRFHDFRRDATTRMAPKFANVLELAALTGHKSLDMLKVYFEPTPADLAGKLDRR